MTGPSSNSVVETVRSSGLIRALLVLAATASIFLLLWFLAATQINPYVEAALRLEGSRDTGSQLFRMNCAGCHGIKAQGLVGPNLRGISHQRNDAEIIQQVISGQTPPMPSFEMDPQAMADLLAHLHSLN